MRGVFAALLVVACNGSPAESGAPGSGLTSPAEPENCWDGVGEFGIEVGNCAPDFTLSNQRDNANSLRDKAGDIIILDCSAMW